MAHRRELSFPLLLLALLVGIGTSAGAQQVVASCWRISDLGAALVVKHLVRQLAKGQAPAAALQHAQQQVRQRLPHPGFWASFALWGN